MINLSMKKKAQKLPNGNKTEEMTPEAQEMLPNGNTEDTSNQISIEKDQVLEQDLNISSQGMNEPSHFDDLINAQEEAEHEQEREAITSTMLTQEDFRLLWVKAFSGASMLTGIKALRLPNGHVDIDAAHAASDAIYETILDIPALHFMLHPSNKWIERAFVVGMFGMGMRAAVIEEAIQRRKEAQKDAPRPAPAAKSHDTGDLTPEQAAALTGA